MTFTLGPRGASADMEGSGDESGRAPFHTASPWLTVVIPAYRGEKWIDTALRSIAAEPTSGIRVLLVDGGPTPASCEVARRYRGRLDILILERPDLGSWHDKTNFAVERATSDHIAWLGVDDVWQPGRVSAIRSWINNSPQTVLHLAPAAIIDDRGSQLGIWRCPLRPEIDLDPTEVTERLLVQNFIAAPVPIFRRDAWLRCGGLDTSLWYTADWDMWLKLAAVGTVRYHRDVTVGFRIHDGALTVKGSRDAKNFADQMGTVLDRHLPRLERRSNLIEPVARASIRMNASLASASNGRYGQLPGAVLAVLKLGPNGIRRYWRDSRLVERVAPRVRARLFRRL